MLENPLTDKPPKEIPLVNAPLVKVIAQVRFPKIIKIADESFIGDFQEAVRKQYPNYDVETETKIVIKNSALSAGVSKSMVWRFRSAGGNWTVSLGQDFVSLDCQKYSSRDDFLKRFHKVVQATETCFSPQIASRIGMRYVDHFGIENVDELNGLLNKYFTGMFSSPIGSYLEHSGQRAVFSVPESSGKLNAHWGLLPPGKTFDASIAQPMETTSFVLDFDMFRMDESAFSHGEIMEFLQFAAERLYTMFRWVVTDGFLKKYGGKI